MNVNECEVRSQSQTFEIESLAKTFSINMMCTGSGGEEVLCSRGSCGHGLESQKGEKIMLLLLVFLCLCSLHLSLLGANMSAKLLFRVSSGEKKLCTYFCYHGYPLQRNYDQLYRMHQFLIYY